VVTAVLAGKLGQWSLGKSLLNLLHPLDIPGARAALPGWTWRQTVRALPAIVRRPVAARGHCPGAVSGTRGAAGRRAGVGDGPGAGRAHAVDPLPHAREHNVTLVASLHAVELALAHFPRIIGLRDGQILFDLPASGHREMLDTLYANEQLQSPRRARPDCADPAMLTRDTRDPAACPRLLLSLLAIALLWPGIQLSELDLACCCSDSQSEMGRFVSAFWPPAHDAIPPSCSSHPANPGHRHRRHGPGAAAGVPASLLASRALSLSAASAAAPERLGAIAALAGARLLIFLRSVPEIVWALLFVRAVGLGPAAGVLAIAITYSGMLGKVYAEIFESVDQRPAHALLQAGSGRLAAFAYGICPMSRRSCCRTRCIAGNARFAPRW
jgi:phosphonate transport system permease protein